MRAESLEVIHVDGGDNRALFAQIRFVADAVGVDSAAPFTGTPVLRCVSFDNATSVAHRYVLRRLLDVHRQAIV